MSATRTTANNPGAFQTHRVPGLAATARVVARDLRRGRLVAAGLRLVTGLANASGPLLERHGAARFSCPCCGQDAPFFVHRTNGRRISWNSICPHCSARSRHRALAAFLPELLAREPPGRALHFAPEPILRSIFVGRPGLVYETCDLYLSDVTHRGVDVQHMPFADASYDLLLSNHVLEHVEDDHAAMAEMARILRPGGLAIITVPGDFHQDATVPFVGERPNGHYRHYGLDVLAPLRRAFGHAEAVNLHRYDHPEGGGRRAIHPFETAFVCRRTRP